MVKKSHNLCNKCDDLHQDINFLLQQYVKGRRRKGFPVRDSVVWTFVTFILLAPYVARTFGWTAFVCVSPFYISNIFLKQNTVGGNEKNMHYYFHYQAIRTFLYMDLQFSVVVYIVC